MANIARSDIAFIVVLVVLSAVLCTSFPLLTYACGLAFFGIAHVVRELNYIDQRFGARINGSIAIILGSLLLLVMCARIVNVFHLVPANLAYNVELVLVFLLALSSQLYLTGATFLRRLFALALAMLIGLGFFISLLSTILVLSVLHNLTPMGFIVEIVPKDQRKMALFLCSVCFVLVPLAISFGLFLPLLEKTVGIHHDWSIFPTGPLTKHLGVFLPTSLKHAHFASNAFSAIVFAQCMHYLAVIYVMPKLLKNLMPEKSIKPIFSWPTPGIFWLMIGVATSVLVVLYTNDFFFARSIYGIAAALHAYLEIPLLIWAFFSTAPALAVTGIATMRTHLPALPDA